MQCAPHFFFVNRSLGSTGRKYLNDMDERQYQAPEAKVFIVQIEGVVCLSPTPPSGGGSEGFVDPFAD